MKQILLLVFLCLQALPGNAQTAGFLYGFSIYSQNVPPYNYKGLAEYNTFTNELATWSQFSEDYFAFGDHAIDPVHGRYLQVIGDSLNMYLKDIDFTTGEVLGELFTVDSVGGGQPGSVTIGGNINGTFYNCADGQVYFFHYKAPYEDSTHLAKVDPVSYEVTELAAFPISHWSFDNVVSNNQQKIYLGYYNYFASSSEVITYDISSNTTSSVTLSQPGFNIQQLSLTYNVNDGNLYGVDYDLDSFVNNNFLADLRIVKVDPETGAFNYLTPDFLGNLIGGNMVLYPPTGKLYFILQQSNPGYAEMGVYDIVANTTTIYPMDNLNTSGFSATTLGIDLYAISKDCTIPTGGTELFMEEACETLLMPTLTSGMLSLSSSCAFNHYEHFYIDVIDLLGRTLVSERMDGNNINVAGVLQANAPYLYRFREGEQVIKSGKVIFID
ncbi:MAG: hypothetical protein IPG01_09020 [Chitinophagaceae bacterium]|nr:hypothetical protein [Chitinophagaceae bacterium]